MPRTEFFTLNNICWMMMTGDKPNNDSTRGTSKFAEQSQPILIWGTFFTLSFLVWWFFSSGDFSFFLTYASLWRCFGLALLNYRVWVLQNPKSISLKSLELYAIVFTMRLLSIMRHQGSLTSWIGLYTGTLTICSSIPPFIA